MVGDNANAVLAILMALAELGDGRWDSEAVSAISRYELGSIHRYFVTMTKVGWTGHQRYSHRWWITEPGKSRLP